MHCKNHDPDAHTQRSPSLLCSFFQLKIVIISTTQLPAHTCSHCTTPGYPTSCGSNLGLLQCSNLFSCYFLQTTFRKKCPPSCLFLRSGLRSTCCASEKFILSLGALPWLQMAPSINKQPGLGFMLPENTSFFPSVHSICPVFHWPSLTVPSNHNFDTMGFSPHVCGFRVAF